MIADATRTRAVYDRHAAAFARHRDTGAKAEAEWLGRLTSALGQGDRILDVGCGTGRPVAAWLASKGFLVTGLDFSPQMLVRARLSAPGGDWRLGDMRTLDLPDRFAAVIAWGSLFHLTPQEQRDTLPRLARHVLPGGRLLLTVGPEAGETTGLVYGDQVYHASLAPSEYSAILQKEGLKVLAYVASDPTAGGHSILLAERMS